jgi:hypothetical protein
MIFSIVTGEHSHITSFIVLAHAHSGMLLPDETKKREGGGMTRGTTFVQISAEIPDEYADNFKLIAESTGLLPRPRFLGLPE